jgi:hypothetical protein
MAHVGTDRVVAPARNALGPFSSPRDPWLKGCVALASWDESGAISGRFGVGLRRPLVGSGMRLVSSWENPLWFVPERTPATI